MRRELLDRPELYRVDEYELSWRVYATDTGIHPDGVDFISSSGGTALFIIESALTKGLRFSSVWSVGNSKQNGVEDILEYMDRNFDPVLVPRSRCCISSKSSNRINCCIHASSLIRKGCKIAGYQGGKYGVGKASCLFAYGRYR